MNVSPNIFPNNIKIVSIGELKPYQKFRFRSQFWEVGKEACVIWPVHGHTSNRIIINNFILTQKVAIKTK